MECLHIAKITRFPGQLTQLSPFKVNGNTIKFVDSTFEFNIDNILNESDNFERAGFASSVLVNEILIKR